MSASFYDLLKYAKTGIASPDMTGFDKLRAMAMAGKEKTLTGIPPLSFKADGKPLISWSMKGNGQQTGTPSPDNIIMPTFCGVRTAQLFDKDNQACYFPNTSLGQGSQWEVSSSGVVLRIPCSPSTAYTISLRGEYTQNIWNVELTASDDITTVGNPVSTNTITNTKPSKLITSFTTLSNTKYILLQLSSAYINSGGNANIMLNTGSTALPYEPYGWAEKITCAGQTVPVYLGQVQTVRKIKKYEYTGQETDLRVQTVITATNAIQLPTTINDYKKEPFICSHMIVTNSSGGSQTHGYYGQQLTLCFALDMGLDTLKKARTYLQQQYAAGTPVTVWYVLEEPTTGIVNEPLAKIGDYADELHSEDAGVTIPTAKGQNTLTVETDLQPSEMTITYRG